MRGLSEVEGLSRAGLIGTEVRSTWQRTAIPWTKRGPCHVRLAQRRSTWGPNCRAVPGGFLRPLGRGISVSVDIIAPFADRLGVARQAAASHRRPGHSTCWRPAGTSCVRRARVPASSGSCRVGWRKADRPATTQGPSSRSGCPLEGGASRRRHTRRHTSTVCSPRGLIHVRLVPAARVLGWRDQAPLVVGFWVVRQKRVHVQQRRIWPEQLLKVASAHWRPDRVLAVRACRGLGNVA